MVHPDSTTTDTTSHQITASWAGLPAQSLAALAGYLDAINVAVARKQKRGEAWQSDHALAAWAESERRAISVELYRRDRAAMPTDGDAR